MQVLKFGGTSVGTVESIKLVMDIILNASKKSKIIAVVSAFSGITNSLLKAIQQAKNGNEQYKETLKEIQAIHFDCINALKIENSKILNQFVIKEMDKVATLCQGIYITKSISQKTEAEIVSTGEILSSFILANAMKVGYIDSRKLIKTSSKYNNATVDFKKTNKFITDFFESNDLNINILGGFISSNNNDETTTLGRGGSDYSAAIYASALDVDKLEIWTDVSGMFTANPKVVKSAFPIEQISYQEAMELSHFGAKVIYPPTIIPVLDKNIPIQIKNTFSPNDIGTLISNNIVFREQPITGISHIENVALITLEGNGMIGIPGFSKRLFEALYYERINVKLITQASSEHSICIAIDIKNINKVSQTVNQAFEYEILTKKVLPLKVETDLSIVAIVGDQMKSHAGISGKLFAALGDNNVNVRAIAQGASERNISVVVATKAANMALIAIHDAFFNSNFKTLHLFITGVGNVGATLLQQINKQQNYLKEKQNINIQVIGISNSKKMLFNANGIDLNHWKDHLKQDGKTSSFQTFFENTKTLGLSNSIFIDNTANSDLARRYTNYLKAKIAVVTCNKVACSMDMNYYNELQEIALKNNTDFLYETNVGAGLPIIDTLRKLILTGDRIVEIQAVLSGSLNYIFNNFESGNSEKTFYKVVKQAGIKGYTEPDPRIDLSGVDVARKILILARESGLQIELSDIENNSFLPIASQKVNTVDDFVTTLKKESSHFDKIYNKALKNKAQLKYVASLKNGKAKVSLQEIIASHPFYNLQGSDNMVLFYTDRYSEQPLIIKGAGAGAEVTAAGLFGDILRVL